MNFNEFEKYKSLVDSELDNLYSNGPKLLLEPINHILKGGKRLRPLLCILSYESIKNDRNSEILSVATSIELLHIFSLIHDDIMDNDKLRHGVETIHTKWSIPVGILAGDAVLALAMKKINKSSKIIIEKFNDGLLKVCEGQALDVEFESVIDLDISEYIKMINLKTGYMLGLSAQLGSLAAGLDLKSSSLYMDFGLLLGEAFQLQDDLLEIISTKEQMGKSLTSDIVLNKKTYLYINAYKKFPEELDSLFNKFKYDNSKLVENFRNLLYEKKIIEECSNRIDSTFCNIYKLLDDINCDKNKLSIFVNNIRNRKF